VLLPLTLLMLTARLHAAPAQPGEHTHLPYAHVPWDEQLLGQSPMYSAPKALTTTNGSSILIHIDMPGKRICEETEMV
jgi:hypothetical protein